MLSIYSFNSVLLIVFAIFFYRVAESEDAPAFLWAALSVAISVLMWFVLKWGLLGMILGQVVFFIGIGVFRAVRKS